MTSPYLPNFSYLRLVQLVECTVWCGKSECVAKKHKVLQGYMGLFKGLYRVRRAILHGYTGPYIVM